MEMKIQVVVIWVVSWNAFLALTPSNSN